MWPPAAFLAGLQVARPTTFGVARASRWPLAADARHSWSIQTDFAGRSGKMPRRSWPRSKQTGLLIPKEHSSGAPTWAPRFPMAPPGISLRERGSDVYGGAATVERQFTCGFGRRKGLGIMKRLLVAVLVLVAALLSVVPASAAPTQTITFTAEPVAVATADGRVSPSGRPWAAPGELQRAGGVRLCRAGRPAEQLRRHSVDLPATRAELRVDGARAAGAGVGRRRGVAVGLRAAGTEVHDVVSVTSGTTTGGDSLNTPIPLC